MPTALLVGAFGQRNPGDDALGEAFVAALPGWRILAATSSPGRPGGLSGGCSSVDAGSPRAVARALMASDALVVAGGTIFKTLHPGCGRRPLSLLRRALALTAVARALGKPRAMVGVGAGVLDSSMSRRLSRALVHQTDLLVLRDEESAGVLAAAGAPTPFRVGADATWTLLDPPRPGPPGAGRRIVVALSFLAGGAELPERLAPALAPLVEEGFDVLLQPWQAGRSGLDDVALADALNERLPRRVPVLAPPPSLEAARDGYADVDLVVGLRFHALVAAAAAGTPFVAVAHEPKHAGLARRLGQGAVSIAEPQAALTRGIADGLRRAPASPQSVRAEIEAAEAGMQLLRVLLAAGRAPGAAEVEGLPLSPSEATPLSTGS
jgi:polysaccharide pyruvyl transferase WcaK-like protein